MYVISIIDTDSSLLDNKLIPYRIKVSFPILSDISSLLANPYELKHNRYCYVFTIGILFPISNRYTFVRKNGKRYLSLFYTLLHYITVTLIRNRWSQKKKVERHWLFVTSKSIGWNESNVDSNDINWRAQVGTEPLQNHVTRWKKIRTLDLDSPRTRRRRFVQIWSRRWLSIRINS